MRGDCTTESCCGKGLVFCCIPGDATTTRSLAGPQHFFLTTFPGQLTRLPENNLKQYVPEITVSIPTCDFHTTIFLIWLDMAVLSEKGRVYVWGSYKSMEGSKEYSSHMKGVEAVPKLYPGLEGTLTRTVPH